MTERDLNLEIKAYNPEAIELQDQGFFQILILPIRDTKLGRDLIEVSSEFKVVKRVCEDIPLSSYYSLKVEPRKTTGEHYHNPDLEKPKFELCQVMSGVLKVDLIDVTTGRRASVVLGSEKEDERDPRVLVIRPGVAHRFENLTDSHILYVIHSTSLCTPEDEIPYPFD